jgi:hypothetical protein
VLSLNGWDIWQISGNHDGFRLLHLKTALANVQTAPETLEDIQNTLWTRKHKYVQPPKRPVSCQILQVYRKLISSSVLCFQADPSWHRRHHHHHHHHHGADCVPVSRKLPNTNQKTSYVFRTRSKACSFRYPIGLRLTFVSAHSEGFLEGDSLRLDTGEASEISKRQSLITA